jgi:hypothetical protein
VSDSEEYADNMEKSGKSPNKRVLKYIKSDQRIIDLMKNQLTSPLKLVQQVSKIIRMEDSNRVMNTQTQIPDELCVVTEPTLPFLPIREPQETVIHPPVQSGSLPVRTQRSDLSRQNQENILIEFFEGQFNTYAEIEEEYELMEVTNTEETEMHDFEDAGYVSGNDPVATEHISITPLPVTMFGCEFCSRTFKSIRGLKIHQAIHKRKVQP